LDLCPRQSKASVREKESGAEAPHSKFAAMRSILCLLVIAAASPLLAAKPDVKYFFPAGAARGETAEVTVAGTVGTRSVRAWCDREGVSVTVSENAKQSKLTVTVAADAVPGPCLVRLFNAEGASSPRPFIIGTLPSLLEAETNDTPEKAQAVTDGGVVVDGKLAKSGDVDVYAVDLQAGQTLVAAMTANDVLGSPMDGSLQLLSPDGFVREQIDDAPGLDPRLAFTAPEAGRYFVRAFAFPAATNSSVRLAGGEDYVYRLTLTTGPFATHAVPLAVPAGKTTPVRPAGWNIAEAAAPLSITAPEDEASTLPAWRADLGNTIPLAVTAFNSIIETEPNDAGAPQSIERPAVVTGLIDPPGDADVFAVTGKKGERLLIRAESRSLGYPPDAVLRLIGPDGKDVARVDDAQRDAADALIERSLPADGEYRVEVTDLFDHGGPEYVYRLTIAEVEPDFSLAVKADAFTLTAGKPLSIPVTVTRAGGFAEPIEVGIEDLPDGVSVTPATSKPKDKSEKEVTLTLTADKPVEIDRPFRITGRSGADAGRQRTATASLPIATTSTRDLWLTVVKP
jgi:hypothetical protein